MRFVLDRESKRHLGSDHIKWLALPVYLSVKG